MSVLTKKEIDKLSIMYDGDKNRDASDKIRGFLFQDYITIMSLLQKDVKYVCSEYLEDIDVVFEDGTFEFIQVKYYPKTSPNKEEIATDLYYQYLRFQMLQSTLDVVPRLCIHRNAKVKKPTLDEMKTYIGLGKSLKKTVSYREFEDSVNWLRTDVYTKKGKKEQKKALFSEVASEASLKEFLSKLQITHEVNINEYKINLMETLARTYPKPNEITAEEHWKLILLGLSISYIQKRYLLVNPAFDDLRVDKEEFSRHITESTETKTEFAIVSYLEGIVYEEYGEIINYNNLSDLQTSMLNLICRNTVSWIKKIGETIEGQHQLLNTFSVDDARKIDDYQHASVNDRLLRIAESKRGFLDFIDYLWKIMLNICQDKVRNEMEIHKHHYLFNPCNYMVSEVTDYVCFNFPEDKYITHCVILPSAGKDFNKVKRKIVERMIAVSPKPEKWFFENSKLATGKNYYNYSTADVNENPTIVDLGQDSFYVECMDCIGVEESEWSMKDNCGDCIFSIECIKEGV